MAFKQDQKQYEETVPKVEEGAKNIANGAELTDEQLEVVAGGTGGLEKFIVLSEFQPYIPKQPYLPKR